MASLDDKVLDPITRRPRKVLVCKEHVPMPRHSLTTNSLTIKHTISAPKPSIPGLYRSMMGERGPVIREGESVVGYHCDRVDSPRSLSQGSHAEILKAFVAFQQQEKEKDNSIPTTTTLPVYRQGRFTIPGTVSDPAVVSRLETEESQDPTKDDDSFRTLPVRHRDYEDLQHRQQPRRWNSTNQEGDRDSWDDSDLDDNKQDRVFMMKTERMGGGSTADKEKDDMNSLKDLTASSKLMGHREVGELGVDERDAGPTDDLGRREVIAGM